MSKNRSKKIGNNRLNIQCNLGRGDKRPQAYKFLQILINADIYLIIIDCSFLNLYSGTRVLTLLNFQHNQPIYLFTQAYQLRSNQNMGGQNTKRSQFSGISKESKTHSSSKRYFSCFNVLFVCVSVFAYYLPT